MFLTYITTVKSVFQELIHAYDNLRNTHKNESHKPEYTKKQLSEKALHSFTKLQAVVQKKIKKEL